MDTLMLVVYTLCGVHIDPHGVCKWKTMERQIASRMQKEGTVISRRSRGTLCVVAQLLNGHIPVIQPPLFVANSLDKVSLRLNHKDATAEVRQSLGQGLNGLHIQIIGR